MIAKSYILNNLNTLEKLYNTSTSTKKGLFYSKLAILELCGWIEESMDDIVRRCATRNLKSLSDRHDVEKSIIQRTYGFEYKKHFRGMLTQLLGIITLMKLERKLHPVKFQLMEAALETLKTYRDSEAHTHLKGITKRLDAPSVTRNSFLMVYEGLKDIDVNLRSLKL